MQIIKRAVERIADVYALNDNVRACLSCMLCGLAAGMWIAGDMRTSAWVCVWGFILCICIFAEFRRARCLDRYRKNRTPVVSPLSKESGNDC